MLTFLLLVFLSYYPYGSLLSGILLGGSLMFLLGLVDDVYNLNAKFKLFLQVAIVTVVYLLGVKIDTIFNPFQMGEVVHLAWWLSYPITLLWIVGICNAVNFIDGVDGLAGSVITVNSITLAIVAVSMTPSNSISALIAFILSGSMLAFLAYNSNTYQIRMYGVFLFGYLSEQNDILTFMRDEVSKDDNWRVQEVLAKAFDEFCKNTGYEKALPIIDEWLENDNPNTRRAVTEGLRIWTSRPYFKDNPNEAIRRIVALKEDPSEYVRKSVGNALRDISKKFPELIKDELNNWKLESKEINQVYKLASKLIN